MGRHGGVCRANRWSDRRAHITAVLDIRAYMRSLRRALVLISHYRVELPDWIRRDTPRCIRPWSHDALHQRRRADSVSAAG